MMSPGLIDTPMGRMELERQPTMPVMVDVTPLKRPDRPLPGRPEDIAMTVALDCFRGRRIHLRV